MNGAENAQRSTRLRNATAWQALNAQLRKYSRAGVQRPMIGAAVSDRGGQGRDAAQRRGYRILTSCFAN